MFIVKNIPFKSTDYNVTSPKYNKLTIDKLPIIKKPEQLSYILLLDEYRTKHGKDLKPAISRGGNSVPADTVCPRCGAPHKYIYDNNGGRGQFKCKVCGLNFNKGKTGLKPITLLCPYCGHVLAQKRIVNTLKSTNV